MLEGTRRFISTKHSGKVCSCFIAGLKNGENTTLFIFEKLGGAAAANRTINIVALLGGISRSFRSMLCADGVTYKVFSPRPPVFMDFIAWETKICFRLNMTDLFPLRCEKKVAL